MNCLIEFLDQVGMLFLSDLSRKQCAKCTSPQGFDIPELPTGHGEEKRVFADNKTQMETSHQMCRTRDCTADRVHGIKSNNESSHCFQSARFRQDPSHCFQCAQKWPAHHNARCNAGQRDDAALFQMVQPKRQLLNRFCDHHGLHDYTSRFVCGWQNCTGCNNTRKRTHGKPKKVFDKFVSARFSHES